jgi:hypothetical protein
MTRSMKAPTKSRSWRSPAQSFVKENPNGPTDLYGIDQFTYLLEENCYICPEGKILQTRLLTTVAGL